MAIAAGCAPMINAAPSLVGNTRVRTVIGRRPVIGGMAGDALRAKHARMKDRVSMTAYTRRRQPCELTRGMTFLTGYVRMSASEWELALIMIEVYMIPARWIMTG